MVCIFTFKDNLSYIGNIAQRYMKKKNNQLKRDYQEAEYNAKSHEITANITLSSRETNPTSYDAIMVVSRQNDESKLIYRTVVARTNFYAYFEKMRECKDAIARFVRDDPNQENIMNCLRDLEIKVNQYFLK